MDVSPQSAVAFLAELTQLVLVRKDESFCRIVENSGGGICDALGLVDLSAGRALQLVK